MNVLDMVACASAPMRISLAGGGTDLPSYAERHGGAVVSLAIDQRVTVAASSAAGSGRVAALLGDHRICSDELMRGDVTQAALRRVGARGVQIACQSDAPPCSGLGGSGAFTVALVSALQAPRRPAPAELAETASDIEMVELGRAVGKHDHYIAALGGLQLLHIDRTGRVSHEPIELSEAISRYVGDRLLLFHTGVCRDAGAILATQDRQTRREDRSTLDNLHAIRSLVEPMLDALRHERVDEIGPILDEHWRHKAQLSDAVAVPHAIELYDHALAAGADGGKLLGAGGGGFMLLSCRTDRQDRLRAAMASLGASELRFAAAAEGVRLHCEPLDETRHEIAAIGSGMTWDAR